VICLRAKAHLGIIDLGSVLGQLTPVMVAALLQALSAGRRRPAAFFALALAAAGLALTQNCSRHTLIAAPALSLLMLWVYRRHFSHKPRLFLPALTLAVALVTILPLAAGGGKRLLGALEPGPGSALVLNEADIGRVNMWRFGWDVFLDHPILGAGPGAIHSLAVEHRQRGGRPPLAHVHAHQAFIQALAETGLLGFSGLLALHLAPLSLLWPHRRSRDPDTFFWVWAALAVNLQFLFNGLTDRVLSLKVMMYIHWTVTAAALWQTTGRKGTGGPDS
jgi:O-antigen ligase